MDEPATTPGDAPEVAPAPDGIDIPAAWQATRDFARACQGFVAALLGLARSEVTLARASWPWVFGLLVVLVGLALSMWITLIVLVGWVVFLLTASLGWTLLALLGLHVVLIVSTRLLLRRNVRNLTLPETRAEVGALIRRATGKQAAPP